MFFTSYRGQEEEEELSDSQPLRSFSRSAESRAIGVSANSRENSPAFHRPRRWEDHVIETRTATAKSTFRSAKSTRAPTTRISSILSPSYLDHVRSMRSDQLSSGMAR